MKRSILRWIRFSSISQKIIAGFLFIYILFIANAGINVFTLDQSTEQIKQISTVLNPSIDQIEEFRLMVAKSEFLIYNWVYDSVNVRSEGRQELKKIHANFPEFKDKLTRVMKSWVYKELLPKMDSALLDFEALRKKQEEIMNKLADAEDYTKANVRMAKLGLNSQVLPQSQLLLQKLDDISGDKITERNQRENSLVESFRWLSNLTIILSIALIFMGFIVNWWTSRQIVSPIKYINSVFVKLGEGELPEDKHYPFRRDEIGEMAESADKLVYSLKATSSFAESIGKGDYKVQYQPLSEKDILGNALLDMRNNLARVAEEERIRHWSNEGLVLFSEMMKQENIDLKRLSENIISTLVKYIRANQGALFISVDELDIKSGEEPYLTMQACYAWDTDKSYLEQKIYKGDGLTGQAWQEQATICMDEIPEGYIRITSGLGEANPESILIVPLKLNEDVFGVVELASFNKFHAHEINFVEKIAETIASAIASVRINERTQRLLSESTSITDQMKAQEELMRQNMEELQTTQEFLERSQREAKEKEELLNVAYLMIETDKKFSVKTVNDLTKSRLKFDQIDLEGMAIDYLFFAQDKIEDAKAKLSKGLKWNSFAYLKGKNELKIFAKVSASSIRDENGNVNKYLFIIDDITDAKA
jgi:GAF domain-containing protein